MLKHFRKIASQPILITKTTRSFAQVENIESLTIEPKIDLYTTLNKEEFLNLYSSGYQQRLPGYATPKGTRYYSLRREIVDQNHFRKTYNDDLTITSLGIGSYVGNPTELDDLKMFNGIVESVESGGVNMIDTAINYRYQKSERVVGAALRYLLKQGYSRDELFICSKNGYIPEDADKGLSTDTVISSLIEKGKLKQEDVIKDSVNGDFIHCIHPAFLEDQLERTLTNIGVETLDLYYLHNAGESQIPKLGYQKFLDNLKASFEFCEKKVDSGKIKSYGLATWSCFRAKSGDNNTYLGLEDVVEVAKKVGGDNHKFRYIQLPLNIIMPEAVLEKWQETKKDGKTTKQTLFQVAGDLKINVITSSPLAQGLMMQVPLPLDLFKVTNLGAKHIQFARSVPSKALLSTLVGQKTSRHVKKNLEVIQYPSLNEEEWDVFFKPTKRVQQPEEAVELDE